MVNKIIFIIFSVILIGCSCSPNTEDNKDCSIEDICNSEQQCLNKQCVALECVTEGTTEVCGDGNICYNGKCITPSCTPERDRTICGLGNICLNGECQKDPYYCSIDAPYGICPENQKCYDGECKEFIQCSIDNLNGECIDTWEDCIDGVCKAKVSESIYPTQEDTLNIKLNEPVDNNKYYIYTHVLPKYGYENYSDKRMFGAYNWEEKRITHLFSYKKDVTGLLIKNPKNSKYYYFDWWPDNINDVDFVELDPKVGELTKKRGFDGTPYDSKMWYISPTGKALIDLHGTCRTTDDQNGWNLLVYDIEKDDDKTWCVKTDFFSRIYSLENGDLYASETSADLLDAKATTRIHKLDIDKLESKSLFETSLASVGSGVTTSEDGLFFYIGPNKVMKEEKKLIKKYPVIVDLFTKESKSIPVDFEKFLENEKQAYYLSPAASNGKYLFLFLWIVEYEHSLDYEEYNKSTTKKRIVIALNLKTLKYKILEDIEVSDSSSVSLPSYIMYNKKYNYIRFGSVFDLNTLNYYRMASIGNY